MSGGNAANICLTWGRQGQAGGQHGLDTEGCSSLLPIHENHGQSHGGRVISSLQLGTVSLSPTHPHLSSIQEPKGIIGFRGPRIAS